MEKKERTITIKDLPVMGKGTFGTIYRIDDDTIIKVFNTAHETSMERIEQEKGLPDIA